VLAILVFSIVSIGGPFEGAAAPGPPSLPATDGDENAAAGRERVVASPRPGQGRVVLVADS
jgi:hypothetical protein